MLQKDRIQEAYKLLSQVWSEMELGYIDDDCLQDAVYLSGRHQSNRMET